MLTSLSETVDFLFDIFEISLDGPYDSNAPSSAGLFDCVEKLEWPNKREVYVFILVQKFCKVVKERSETLQSYPTRTKILLNVCLGSNVKGSVFVKHRFA